jgi:hypothetical protein
MAKKRVADLLVDILAAAGVKRIYGASATKRAGENVQLTWDPHPAGTDAERNCIGPLYEAAAQTLLSG